MLQSKAKIGLLTGLQLRESKTAPKILQCHKVSFEIQTMNWFLICCFRCPFSHDLTGLIRITSVNSVGNLDVGEELTPTTK